MRQTTPIDDQNIRTLIENSPFTPATIIANDLGLTPYVVRSRMKEAGLQNCIPAKQSKMTDTNRENRIRFCEENMGLDWDKVIFSDEKTFCSYSDRQTRLWRPKGERFNMAYVQSVKISGRISCGVWGFITGMGVGEVSEISSRMNSIEYTETLEDILIPCMNIIKEGWQENMLFMQDNARIHTSHFSSAWFRSHPEISVLNWPPYSPDLNPIENVWSKLTYAWNQDVALNRAAILKEVKSRWDNLIGTPYVFNLYRSMPTRLQEVLDNNGNWCRY